MKLSLSNDVISIFSKIKSLGLPSIVNDIIESLKSVEVGVKQILTTNNITVDILSNILGNKYQNGDYEDFVKIFNNHKMGSQKRKIEMEMDSIGSEVEITFSNDFYDVLERIDNPVSWVILNLEENKSINNKLEISLVDVSNKDSHFEIVSHGRKSVIKITQFLRYYAPGGKINLQQIDEFIRKYNKLRVKTNYLPNGGVSIEVPTFNFDPKNVKSTFISLVTETYPHGTEEDVMKYMPQDLDKDKFGNYYKIIGESDVMFTSHLDTASKNKEKINLVTYTKSGQEFIISDGTTILGADDKAGVTVMLYMMAHNVPGLYYFFLGEERGGIGSGKVADVWNTFPFSSKIKKCISFDRRNYYSVITEQMGLPCCSNEFADLVCKELNKSGLKLGLDPTGVFTDSANFIDSIAECTNISVGYFNEHTHDEVQNISFLERLAHACVASDWSNIKANRKVDIDEEIMRRYSGLFDDYKQMGFFNECKLKGEDGFPIINITFDDDTVEGAYNDLSSLEDLFVKHGVDPDIRFDGDTIKIKID